MFTLIVLCFLHLIVDVIIHFEINNNLTKFYLSGKCFYKIKTVNLFFRAQRRLSFVCRPAADKLSSETAEINNQA